MPHHRQSQFVGVRQVVAYRYELCKECSGGEVAPFEPTGVRTAPRFVSFGLGLGAGLSFLSLAASRTFRVPATSTKKRPRRRDGLRMAIR